MTADDLLAIAADLVRRETGRPRQASLVDLATPAIALLRTLSDDRKRQLAVQLIAKTRPRILI